ncbi:MAG: DUF1460 domain-containing protein [Cyclonatronaceae bacterium]
MAVLLAMLLLTGCRSENSRADAGTQGENTAETIEQWLEEGLNYWRQVGDVSSLVAHYADRQLGITYVGGLLDEPDEEQLVVTLDGSDCVIYVEMSLAMAMTTLQGQTSYEDFRENLAFIRYREGDIDGYPSRLHYFSDWLLTNQEKDLLDILFQEEGLPAIEPPDFMSQNRENYRHLAENDQLFEKIQAIEEQLADHRLVYIPQDRIPEFQDRFETGDILAFVTTIEGMDMTHTGLVKMEGDRAGFYHASMTGSVIVDPDTIHEYTLNRRNINGIVVARLKSPQM